MILGSIYVTAGALIVGVPIGILTAVFLAKYCPESHPLSTDFLDLLFWFRWYVTPLVEMETVF